MMTRRRFLALFLLCAALFTGTIRSADAGSVTVAWDASPAPEVVAYRLYYGTATGEYSQHVIVQGATTATVGNLLEQQTYFFAVTAFSHNSESAYSNEVFYTVPAAIGPPVLSAENPLVGVSTRAHVNNGDRVMIGGFILRGVQTKRVLLRALGPSLLTAGVAGVLPDPALDLYNSRGQLVASNDDWHVYAEMIPRELQPGAATEAGIVANLPPGSYTAVARANGTASGVALFELYDLERAASHIANLSTRALVGTGENVLIGGFTIGGAQSTKVILRALGPSFASGQVQGALEDPVLALHNEYGSLIHENDNWRDTQEAQIIASTVPPAHDRESAIVATLRPGRYTAIMRGVGGTSGIGLVEIYNLDLR